MTPTTSIQPPLTGVFRLVERMSRWVETTHHLYVRVLTVREMKSYCDGSSKQLDYISILMYESLHFLLELLLAAVMSGHERRG